MHNKCQIKDQVRNAYMLVNTLAATVNQGMEPWEGFLYMTLELPFQIKYEH